MPRKVCQNTSCYATGECVDQTDYCSEICELEMCASRQTKNNAPVCDLSIPSEFCDECTGKNSPDMVTADNRFVPDWEQLWTKEEAEQELCCKPCLRRHFGDDCQCGQHTPFKFNGPGWYLSKGVRNGKVWEQALLVIPDSIPCAKSAEVASAEWQAMLESNPFAKTWPPGTKFRFYCYDGRNPIALFSAIANAPTRLDER